MLGKTLKNSFNVKIFFIFAVFAIVFFLTVGMPTPPGLLYKVSESYLQSLPGYSDIKTGSINPALLEDNVDSYNSYLMSVIVIITANLIGYFFLFVLASVVAWNYILKDKLSVRGFWRSALFNVFWLLFGSFIAVLAYGAFTFVGSIGPAWWSSLMMILFAITLVLLVVFTLICNCNIQKSSLLLDSFVHSLKSLHAHFWKFLIGIVAMFLAVFLTSLLFYIPAISFALVTAFVTLVQLFGLAWLHLYVNEVLSLEKNSNKA